MNDKSPITLAADSKKAAKEHKYIPADAETINKLSVLGSQELYGTFDVPFVRGFSMLLRAVSNIKAKELNEE